MSKRKKVNRAWLAQHIDDPYVKLAQKHGYRSRAAYKLIEIDAQDHLIRPGITVVDLGSTPGAWSQVLRERLARRSAAELAALFEQAGLPFAPIRKPEDLYDDPHLQATGGLADVVLPDGDKAGQSVKTTLLPVALQGARLPVRLDPPRFGAHTQELLEGLGYERTRIDALRARRAVA